jgi:hypothetical protein
MGELMCKTVSIRVLATVGQEVKLCFGIVLPPEWLYPPGEERNWAIGCKATITNIGDWTTELLGTIESKGTFIIAIPSLFQAQLIERLSNLLSVKDVPLENENRGIAVFPNPANDSITITKTMIMNASLSITIHNSLGQRVKNLPINQNQLSTEYNISDLVDGIYFVHFKTATFYKTIQLIVKR